jgi:hypothetical protein
MSGHYSPLQQLSAMNAHRLSPPLFPDPWASYFGEDRYGLWQAFTYSGVRHVFRWLPPG